MPTKDEDFYKQELLTSAKVYETLFVSKETPKVPGFSIALYCLPSKYITKNFFDFYQPVPNLFDIIIGDVQGHGIPAAFVGTALKSHLIKFANPLIHIKKFDKSQFWYEDILSPEEILMECNPIFVEQLIRLNYLVSLFYARFNRLKKHLTFINCGFTKPIHYQKMKEKAYFLKGNNSALGSQEKEGYESFKTPYDINDLFVFYSEGVTQVKSKNHEHFGEERLLRLIEKNASLSANDLLLTIKNNLETFTQEKIFENDFTLLIIKIDEIKFDEEIPVAKAKFLADLSQLKAVRAFIERLCYKAPSNTSEISDQLQLAINEIFCNIVKHGIIEKNKDKILIQGDFTEEGILIDIADRGQSFDPTKVNEPSFAGDKSYGFGWYIIQEIADQIEYRPKSGNNGWNHTKIFKKYCDGEYLMELANEMQNDILIITPKTATLDAKESPEFKEKAMGLINSNNTYQVVIDMSHLHFIDSSGLGTFLSILRTLNAKKGSLKLSSMNKSIRKMFELVSMHKIFEIFNSKEEAIQSFQKITNE